jgi:hypothetical protein
MLDIYCEGCGVKLQTETKEDVGYTPPAALERESVLCQRCFRLRHYNETQDVPMTDDDFLKMISSIRDTNSLIVHMIDIFDVHGSLLPSLPRITGNNPILLVANKFDLLPKSTNKNKLIQWLKKEVKEAGIKVQDAFLISSVKGIGMDELKIAIEEERKGKDVYVVGATNVGKSTFINRLIKETTGHQDIITTSYFPGTTLGFIQIPLDDTSSLIDTPGIINKDQIIHYLSEKDLKTVVPRKEIKSRVYQLNTEQTLFIGALARIDFIKGDKQSFICYFSNELEIHRTKLEKADDLYSKHKGELLSPPTEKLDEFPPLTKHSFKLSGDKKDIVFSGLGWITLNGEEATVVVSSPKGVRVTVRDSLI